jgi:hypothetical protein
MRCEGYTHNFQIAQLSFQGRHGLSIARHRNEINAQERMLYLGFGSFSVTAGTLRV